MSIKAILFDLDGTLLPMEQERFAKDYFGRLAIWMRGHGYEPEKVICAIWQGTAAMVKNDGTVTNETRFWDSFAAILGEDVRGEEPYLRRFYEEEFDKVSASCGHNPDAAAVIDRAISLGYRVALATNPLFPAVATYKRMGWAGLNAEDFEMITTYENSSFCKPNPDYYRWICESLGVLPEECLMVGNDVGEDMIAERLGMSTFLVTPDLINRGGEDISRYPSGTLKDCIDYLNSLP